MDDFVLHLQQPKAKEIAQTENPAPQCISPAVERVNKKRHEEVEEVSRKRPKRSSEKTYSRFHLSAKELSGRAMVSSTQEKVVEKTEAHVSTKEFEAIGISERLASACLRTGLKRPTTVQSETLRALSKAKSALIVAPTGSGKTLAYALPMLDSLKGKRREDGLAAVIIAPTRELCLQISQAISRLGQYFDVGIVTGAVTGGERRKSEKARLRKGVVILCATPGRLLDHLKSTEALLRNLASLSWFVLDEVDRLLDLGLGPQVDELRQMLFFQEENTGRQELHSVVVTATLDARVLRLASKHLGGNEKYARITVSSIFPSVDTASHKADSEEAQRVDNFLPTLPQELRLEYCVITLKLRLPALAATLRRRNDLKTLVFTSSCASAELHYGIASTLFDNGSSKNQRCAERLHGGMDHIERKQAYDRFCAGDNNVLFATDVAARGLDFARARVDWVLHLDPPREISAFVHRSGRAARAGRSGTTTIFLLPSERRGFLDAISARGISQPNRVGLPSLSLTSADADKAADDFQLQIQATVQNDAELLARARDAFAAHLRAYASKPDPRLLTNEDERRALGLAFNLRKLHLGHAAKAFALTESPRAIATKQRAAKAATKASNKGTKRHAKYETTHFTTRVGPDGAKLKKVPAHEESDFAVDHKGSMKLSIAAKRRRKQGRGGSNSFISSKPLHRLPGSTAPPSFHVSEFSA